jgi:hypothetical protein
MEERIPTSDQVDLNVPDSPGVNGELEPFVMAHNAHFVGLLLASGFRRSRARSAAVAYGTATNAGLPLSSFAVTELAYYYNHLIKQDELDQKSADIYEEFEVKRIDAESLSYRLRNEDLSLEEKQELLNELTDLAAEIEKMTEQMETLASA